MVPAHELSVRTFGLLFVLGFLMSLYTPGIAHAHGAGLTLTSTTTDYFVDVDYSAYSVIADESGRFDFKLFTDAARTEPVDFTQVWARVVRKSDLPEGTTVFSGWIARATFGTTGMSIALHDPGAYELRVQYNKGDDKIIDATLPFTVDPSMQQRSFRFGAEFWSGIALGLLLAFFAVAVAILRRRIAKT